ncbi:MAG: hypothetical protein P8R37_09195 [Opitutae bacterium]|nr:hypothetical protein [Opitutae bacterium]
MKAGAKQIIAGAIVFGIGVICVPFLIVLTLLRDRSDLLEFEVPGVAMAFVDTPGRYYLWHDYQTMYDGRTYHNPIELPDDLVIKISAQGGIPLDFVSDSHASFSTIGRARQSLGYVEVNKAVQVTIDVTGGAESRIFSFSPFSVSRFVGLIVKGFLFAGLAAISSLGLIIWGIVKLANAPRKTAKLRS